MAFAKVSLPALVMLGSLVFSLSHTYAQSGARDEASWEPLGEEVSRGTLFKDYADEKAAEEKGKPQIFAFPSSFQFSRDARFDTDGSERHDRIFGVDISHYEPNFPLGELKRQKVSFVYMKATQGTRYKDETFAPNWKAMAALPEAQHIPRGAYHFLSADAGMSGKAQADSFVDYVALHGNFRKGDLPPAMDLEWDKKCKTCPDRWKDRSPTEIVDTAVEFLNRVKERTGRMPLIYTNKSFLNDVRITKPELVNKLTAGYKVWIFDLDGRDRRLELPNPDRNLKHVLWQFSFTGALPGIYGGNFDVSVFKGTTEQFNATFTGSD